MARRVLVVGGATADLVTQVSHFPKVGETVLGHDFQIFPGGKGLNQAIAAARLGAEVAFIGCVGDDAFGDIVSSTLSAEAIDVRRFRRVPGVPTATGAILVDSSGQNQIAVNPGANLAIDPQDVFDAIAEDPEAIVVSQLETSINVVLAASTSKHFVLNPAPAVACPPEVFSRCWVATPNELEARMLLGLTDDVYPSLTSVDQGLRHLGIQHPIQTLGESGAAYGIDGELRVVPAPKVEVVDTTAAGDAFTGALVAALSFGHSLPEVVEFAVHCASLSVTKAGAVPSLVRKQEPPIESLTAVRSSP